MRGARVALFAYARAKVNLSLDVFETRPDGYHEIASVMQSVAYSDLLTFEASPGGVSLQVTGEPVAGGRDNLVARAAECLLEATNCKRGAAIRLQKNIPVSAGLGGGSADAAATLIGLNRLWGLRCDLQFLKELGAFLGADVPFCLTGGTALATGRGETTASLPPLPELGVLLLKPPYGVSTAAVYRGWDALRPEWRPASREMAAALAQGSWQEALRKCGNALEEVVLREHSELGVLKRELTERGALCALVSGSGPAVYGIFPTLVEAAAAGDFFQSRDLRVIATTTATEGVLIK
ncbi:MAG TPA: 4-(cytidine 5'-diphospho)-2-C-methyl-D-erythritol kinase [Desulfotomaculum sp.]|nr:4-(cytidine 5'-diphospho)-2-C-methyl-D-erythritol kinase [Desulfotomaculum sp.]